MSSSDPVSGRLVVRSPGATLDILDSWLQPLTGSGAIGELSLDVAPGTYQVSARIAATENTQLVVVRPGPPTEIDVPVRFDAAAPVEGTTTANETHGDLAQVLTGPTDKARATAAPSRSSSLVVILRGLRNRVMAPLPSTDAPFELFDQRGRPVRLPAPTPESPEPTPESEVAGRIPRAVGWAVPLRPGGYRLRWSGPSEQPVEHTAWLSPGWQTLLFVPQSARGPSLPEMSIHLLRTGTSWNRHSSGWLAVEAALAILRGTTARTVDPRSEDFATDADNPMLALLTLHILGRARSAGMLDDNTGDQHWTRRAAAGIRQLRRSLGQHPDVAALAEQWPTGSEKPTTTAGPLHPVAAAAGSIARPLACRRRAPAERDPAWQPHRGGKRTALCEQPPGCCGTPKASRSRHARRQHPPRPSPWRVEDLLHGVAQVAATTTHRGGTAARDPRDRAPARHGQGARRELPRLCPARPAACRASSAPSNRH